MILFAANGGQAVRCHVPAVFMAESGLATAQGMLKPGVASRPGERAGCYVQFTVEEVAKLAALLPQLREQERGVPR